jgi:hypothetical protein
MEKAQRVLELADGALVTGETAFERDRRTAISVPWTPSATPEPVLPRTIEEVEQDEPTRWSRPDQRRRPIYQPPGPPNEPLQG